MELPLDRLEIGRLYFKIVDFETAVTNLTAGMKQAFDEKNWTAWCRFLPLLLRIHAERLDFASINQLKQELAGLGARENLKLQSGTCYTLGIAATYEGQLNTAEELFKTALDMARDINESSQARFGLAAINMQRRLPGVAAGQLRELQNDLRDTILVDLKLATGLLLAYALRDMGQLEAAFDLLGPLQETCRIEQNLYMSLNVLYGFGTVYQRKSDTARARQYFEMVQALTAPKELPHMFKQLEARFKELDEHRPSFQLINDRILLKPDGSQIQIGSQFIVRELLKILASDPGQTLSKEDIVKRLWKEEYNPAVHDNKIYVTIKRLRSLLEPAGGASEYILNTRDGYQFNSKFSLKVSW